MTASRLCEHCGQLNTVSVADHLPAACGRCQRLMAGLADHLTSNDGKQDWAAAIARDIPYVTEEFRAVIAQALQAQASRSPAARDLFGEAATLIGRLYPGKSSIAAYLSLAHCLLEWGHGDLAARCIRSARENRDTLPETLDKAKALALFARNCPAIAKEAALAACNEGIQLLDRLTEADRTPPDRVDADGHRRIPPRYKYSTATNDPHGRLHTWFVSKMHAHRTGISHVDDSLLDTGPL
jgi:hypothetical protein